MMTAKVAVVGAGISGLAAAASLVDKGFDVYLLEASDYFGGRLKQVEAFPGFAPIDLGADFMHGSISVLHELSKENGWKVKKAYGCEGEPPKASCIYIDGNLYPVGSNKHPEVAVAYCAWDDIIVQTEKYMSNNKTDRDQDQNSEISLHSWLLKKSLNQKAIDIVDSLYCQTHGGTLDSMGVLESGLDDVQWQNGSGNYRLEESYSVLIAYFVDKCAKVDKRLNWHVKEVKLMVPPSDQSSQTISITSHNGESLQVNYVIITVPLTILKAKDILFSPPLPINKQQAINSIYMGAALKIVCRFKKPFWREALVVYCPRCFIHQVWMYSRDQTSDGEECHVVVGFETASAAAQKVHLSDQVVCERFVQQLDDMYGTESEPKPATTNLMGFVYYHWSKHPYIRGGYSSPTTNTLGLREHLAEPVEGRLFFAGEATSVTSYATVQAALETGVRAANQVCKADGLYDKKSISSKM